MRAVIIANGTPPTPALIRQVAAAADLVVCADGGAHAAISGGLCPHHVVGDCDSLDEETIGELRQMGTELHRYPARKDETDLELTLLHTVGLGADEIVVLGGLGGRLDQTLANIMLLALPTLREIPVRIIDEAHEVQLIDGQGTIRGEVGDVVSLLPIAGDAVGIETDGLEWPLNGSTLSFGAARGVSNRLTKPVATVKVTSGLLVAIRLSSSGGLR